MTRHLRAVPDQPSLDAAVDVQPIAPPPNAGDLVRAWCRAYEDAHGIQPHPSVVRRVAGVCRNVGRDCETVEHWRAAWFAARQAGQGARYDLMPFLAAPSGHPSAGRSRNAAADLLERLEQRDALVRRQVRALEAGDDL